MTDHEMCRYCGDIGPHRTILTPELQHHGRVNCRNCGRMLRWIPKPNDDPTKFKRPAAHLDLVKKFGRGFCELCLRKNGEAGVRELVGHHVIEYKDGGEPKRENVWILCRACERLVHWMRTYQGSAQIQTIGEVLKTWQE